MTISVKFLTLHLIETNGPTNRRLPSGCGIIESCERWRKIIIRKTRNNNANDGGKKGVGMEYCYIRSEITQKPGKILLIVKRESKAALGVLCKTTGHKSSIPPQTD